LASPPGRADAWALGGLAAVVLALFKDIVFGGRVLYERDIHIAWHGLTESFVRCVASGSWPVWDPYLSFGRPFLANPATQVLYPWTWLNLLAPAAVTYTIYVVSHLLLAGVGLYLLARRLGLSPFAGFAAAAVWIGSGPLLSTVNLWNHLAGAAWMPWVVLAADRALSSPGVARSLAWGAAVAAQILAGSPDMCLMTGVVVALHALTFLGRRGTGPDGVRLLRAVLVAIVFALGLSAVVWLPALESARNSGRWEMAEGTRTVWSLHPANLLQVLLPLLPGDLPLSTSTRETLFDAADPFLSSVYVGLPALVLAAASFAGPRPPWVFGVVTLAASVVALGRHSWFYSLAVHLLPPLKILRYPAKAMVPAAFAGALLCAYGFDAWKGQGAARPRPWHLMVVIPAFLGSGLVWSATYLALHPATWGAGLLESPGAGRTLEQALAPAVRKLFVAGLLSAAAALLALARSWRPAHARAGAMAMAVAAVAGLLWAHRDLNPTAPADFYRARPPILDVLQKDHASRVYVVDYHARVMGKTYRRPTDSEIFSRGPRSPVEAAYGLQAYLIPSTGSRWGLYGSYEGDLYSLFSPQLRSLTLILRAAEETPLHDRLLRIGSVDHVVALHQEGLEGLQPVASLPGLFAAPIRVFRVPAPLPRAYVVSGARIADGLQAYRTLADPSFDPSREVVLAEGREEPGAAPAGGARILELRHDRVRIAADLERPGYVVLVDTYDPGWKATVDGQGVPVLRANAAFRAVRVAAGRHLVEMVYRPLSIIVGAALSAAAALIGLGTALARVMGS
jgi:membrane protein YfhO